MGAMAECGWHHLVIGGITIALREPAREDEAVMIASPVGLWSRNDLRARWRSLLVLGVLAGVTTGLAVASFDGALRTGSALSRLEERNLASDAVVFASQSSLEQPHWTTLATRPEVEQIARWQLVFGLVDGVDSVLFAPGDDVFLNTVDRPIVVEGRMFDPAATDEMVITDAFVGEPGVLPGVGDVVHLDAYSSFDPTAPPGPSVDFTVVGVVHSSLSYVFTGGMFISPGFAAAYQGQIVTAENAMVTLRNGAADVAALRRHASTDVFQGVPVLDLQVTARRVTATTDVERAMLLLLAAIIALSGLVFVGQAMARSAAAIGADAPTLRALGMTRRELTLCACWPHALTVVAAVVSTVLTAAIASRWFPVGLAAQVDPDRGFRFDALLLSAAALGVMVLIVAGVALASWLAAGPERPVEVARHARLTRLGFIRPLTVGVGMRMALDGGRRSARRTSRSALVGATAAVAGIVAVITLNHGLADALQHPEVAGIAWDATVVPNPDDVSPATGVDPAVVAAVVAQPGLAAIGTIGRTVTQIGEVGVPTFTVVDVVDGRAGGDVRLVTLTGSAPHADNEVTLGPSTARDLGVGIGDSVRLADGGEATVVGLGLFPSDVHAQFDEGAWITAGRFFGPVPNGSTVSEGAEFVIAVRFADRTDLEAQVAELGSSLGASVQYVAPAELPLELSNLHNVQRLPEVLAAFLAVLGVVATGHGLFQSVRLRRKDFAVMGALGITRRGSRLILAAHATMLALVGLAFGVPLGLLAGRTGWQAITDRVPITFRSPFALVAVLLVVPAAILVANVLAVLPARRAAKLDPALVLRTE